MATPYGKKLKPGETFFVGGKGVIVRTVAPFRPASLPLRHAIASLGAGYAALPQTAGRYNRMPVFLTRQWSDAGCAGGYDRLHASNLCARKRPHEAIHEGCMRPTFAVLDFSLLRNLPCIIDLYSTISNGALQFRMAEQELEGP